MLWSARKLWIYSTELSIFEGIFEAFVKKVFGNGISVKRVDGEFSRAREAEGSCGFRGTHDKPIVILEEPQPQMPQPVDQTKQQSKGHSQEEVTLEIAPRKAFHLLVFSYVFIQYIVSMVQPTRYIS